MAARAGHNRKPAPRPARPRPAAAQRQATALATARPAAPKQAPPRGTRAGLTAPAGLGARGSLAAPATSGPVPPPADGEGAQHEVLRPVVTATYWVDPGESGMPYESVITFTGRRLGAARRPAPADRFEHHEMVRLVPGSGPVAVTTRAEHINPGEWLVRAFPADRRGPARGVDPERLLGAARRPLARILWPKGNPVAPMDPGTRVRTRVAALATAPGIITGSWAGLVAAGLAAALAVLAGLLGRVGVGAGGALLVATAASLAGAAGARGWYVMLQRGQVTGLPTRGLCIQGFIAGAVAAGIPGLALAGIPAGAFFGAAAPGVFFAMAIGRQGCFFTGCCAGRPTASRWGMWSSDGRIGARRIPVQQLESLTCLLIGAAALAAFLRLGPSAGGAVFVGAVAVYTLARQGLLSLRAEQRRWALACPVTLAAAATALAADILIAAMR